MGTKDMEGWREKEFEVAGELSQVTQVHSRFRDPSPPRVLAREANLGAAGFLMVGKGQLGSTQCTAKGSRRDPATF